MKQKKVYRTALGREIDIQQLALTNEKMVALGNANLNARGDQVDARGKVIKKREELAQEYYRTNPKAVRDESTLVEDRVEVTDQAMVSPTVVPAEAKDREAFDGDDGYDSQPMK